MTKYNKERLFEMMNRVGGMSQIHESTLPPGFNDSDFMSLNDFVDEPVNEDNFSGVQVDKMGLGDVITAREKGQYKGQTPYLHPKTIKKIRVVDENGNDVSEEEFRKISTIEPKKLLGPNTKMGKTGLLKTSLPAYKGLFYDEKKPIGERITIVNTCPNAGDCKTYCFQQKGGAVQYEAASLDKTRALNFLLNHWDRYRQKMLGEINTVYESNKNKGLETIIRWHDSGDFISEKYLDMIMQIARDTPNVQHYGYTKMVGLAKGADVPPNFMFRFSVDPGAPDTYLIDKFQDKHAEVVPKKIWKGFVYVQNEPIMTKKGVPAMQTNRKTGKMEIKNKKVYHYNPNENNDPDNGLLGLKNAMAAFYEIDVNTILSSDEMMKEDENKGVNIWNVIITPSDADTAAHRKDVLGVFLLIH